MKMPKHAETEGEKTNKATAGVPLSFLGHQVGCLQTLRESHEGLECLKCPEPPASPEWPESPKFPMSPVSEGQELEKELEALAGQCACSRAEDKPREKLFELARGVKALEQQSGWRLETSERLSVFTKWHEASKLILDETKDYLAEFFAAIPKVRVPKGEGDTIAKAIENILNLSISELPEIVQVPGAPETWRRIFALHCELSRRSTKEDKTYFLSSRDAAKVCPSLSHQIAHKINGALAEVGAIEIVRAGDKRKGGKATEFRSLLLQ
jgi:hypothetical protein